MKKILPLVALALLAVACDNEENSPTPISQELVPLKMEDLDGSRELIYDTWGKISGLSETIKRSVFHFTIIIRLVNWKKLKSTVAKLT